MSIKNHDQKILQQVFEYFKKGFINSHQTRKQLRDFGLKEDVLRQKGIEIGYNSAQFHHRQNSKWIDSCLRLNLLSPNPSGGNQTWGKMGVILPLRNDKQEIVNLYAFKTDSEERIDIFLNSAGLFPNSPDPTTQTLIITDNIIDCCFLLQTEEISKKYTILALDNFQLTDDFLKALKGLSKLEEIMFFQGESDEALKESVNTLKKLLHKISLSIIQLPDGEENIKTLLKNNEPAIVSFLIAQRQDPFSGELRKKSELPVLKAPNQEPKKIKEFFNTDNPYCLTYSTSTANYSVLGGVRRELDSMRITLMVENKETKRRVRKKLDLYEDHQIEKSCTEIEEKLLLRSDFLQTDLHKLTDHLEEHRNKSLSIHDEEIKITVPADEENECKKFLSQKDLLKRINEFLGKCIVGEQNNRLFLFIIASSYKTEEPLHALIQGSSGSGKTHLLNRILNFLPPEDVIAMTRVSEKSFYNFDEQYLNHKILGMEDLDGLKEEAFLAFRELQSRGQLASSISYKDKQGGISSRVKVVQGNISSLSCTTKGSIYEDNMSRCFLIATDESDEQTERIIKHQNKKFAGKINHEEQKNSQKFLQNCMRVLQSYDVINPFAEKITLPKEAHKIRRLNQLYQVFVKQITVLHQYQRNKDKQGRLITEKQDLELACQIMFDSILLKIDELDGSLRMFFEFLKTYVKEQSKEQGNKEAFESYTFTQRDIRFAIRLSKSQLQRYFTDLLELEYIQLVSRNQKGFKYRIVHWDSLDEIKSRTRKYLYDQLAQV